MNYDFIVVGHGLAGAILGYTLRKRGHKVLVIDEPKPNSASNVAAGLVNPIAGKRFAKSWRADEFIPAANKLYKELEQHFSKDLFIQKPIYKIFSSIEEQNTWMAKSADEGWEGYIEDTLTKSIGSPSIQDPFGGILINQGGYLMVAETLKAITEELLVSGALLPQCFEMDKLQLTQEGVNYKGIAAKRLIFCEGYQMVQNPYFKWLPLQPTKGEILEVEVDNFEQERIYNKAVYVVPIGGNKFKIGATYNWREPDEEPSTAGAEELAGRFRQITTKHFRIIGHQAGIRPAVRDRTPLVGQHPEHTQLYVFNGLGSKGVLMAPLLALNFSEALEGKADLLPEVQISRYFSLYYN